jgi:hypothetical protein
MQEAALVMPLPPWMHEQWISGFLGSGAAWKRLQRGLFTGPVDCRAGPDGPRGSTFLLLAFKNRKLKRFEAFMWVGPRILGVPPANDLAVPGEFYPSISVARSVGKYSDGPARDFNCKFSSTPQSRIKSFSVVCARKAIGPEDYRVAGALP